MQQTRSMTLGEGIMGAGVSALAVWLVSSFAKVSKADFNKLLVRVDALEKDLTNRMTRTEFEHAFGKVEALVREFRLETRSEFKELKIELKTKT